jgi:diaminopimelate epimerase
MTPFVKMQGIGNDFVFLDVIQNPAVPADLAEFSRQVCDRRFGVGSDGLILLERGEAAPFRMQMFNPDGSESEMCGNGIRCFAKLLRDHGHSSENHISVETGAGILYLHITDNGDVEVNMGQAKLSFAAIGISGNGKRFVDEPLGVELNGTDLFGTAVSMGNPHLVIFTDDLAAVPLAEIGPILEHHPQFVNRTNVHFVEVVDRAHLKMRTWERGAGATLACGTGACSVGVTGFINGHSDRLTQIDLPGGRLQIDYREDDTVFMTGPAVTVFHGVWPD